MYFIFQCKDAEEIKVTHFLLQAEKCNTDKNLSIFEKIDGIAGRNRSMQFIAGFVGTS